MPLPEVNLIVGLYQKTKSLPLCESVFIPVSITKIPGQWTEEVCQEHRFCGNHCAMQVPGVYLMRIARPGLPISLGQRWMLQGTN